ncbi:hypothetical protein [Vibrio penaeicida]|nr:hypothetical protein [Vibrio penaeicida]
MEENTPVTALSEHLLTVIGTGNQRALDNVDRFLDNFVFGGAKALVCF